MKNMGLKLALSALACLSIYTTTVAIEQSIAARNMRLLIDQVMTAQQSQPVKLGWDI